MENREAPHKQIELLATNSGFILECQKFPAKLTMDLEIAVATVDESQELIKKRVEMLPEDNAVLAMDFGHLGKSWWGHPEGDVYRKSPEPTFLKVRSEYKATFKPYIKEYFFPLALSHGLGAPIDHPAR